MPDKRIEDLTEATSVQSADLFVLEQSGASKKLTGQVLMNDLATALDGHCGISSITWSTSGTAGNGQTHTGTIHYADGTTSTVEIKDGYKGNDGVGVPSGGTTGQALVKSSGTNYATTWSDVYKKPSGGIPKTDLAAGVQSSLGLADTALQSASDVVFWATYGTTTYGEIGQAIIDNRPVMCARSNRKYVLERTQMVGVDVNCIFTAQDKDGETYYLQLYSNGNVWSEGNTSPHNIASGGTSGQYRKKASSTDYDVAWGDGGGSGTSNYTDLTNKPSINGITLVGNKTGSDLGVEDVFWATFGSTTWAEISQAKSIDGKIVCCAHNNAVYYLTATVPSGPQVYCIFVSVGKDGEISYLQLYSDGTIWSEGTAPATHSIPSGGENGYVLRKSSSSDYAVYWSSPSALSTEEVFWATYGTTTSNQVYSAATSGKIVCCKRGDRVFILSTLTNLSTSELTKSYFVHVNHEGIVSWLSVNRTDNSWDSGSYMPAALPWGGTTGQVLKKVSNNNYDVEWADESGGGGGGSVSPYTSNPAALGTASPGSSDNYARGDHVHAMPTAADVGAIAAPVSASNGQFLMYNGSAWVASSLPTYNGGVS